MVRRDAEFSKAVKRALAEQVNHQCSNPNCPRPTSGPHSNPFKSTKVGEAAHIKAAKPGIRRYDPAMTDEQRRHPDNGIWLCPSCHTLVDQDEDTFSAELLNSWKKDALSKAAQALQGASSHEGSAGLSAKRTEPPIPDDRPLRHGILELEQKVLRGEESLDVFTGLLDRRFNLQGRGYYGIDDACSALNHLKISQPDWLDQASDREIERGENLLQGIFHALARLVGRQDFVLFSSVQEVLGQFLIAQDHLCLALLDGWMKRRNSLHQLFALNALPTLAPKRPEKIIELFVKVATDLDYQQSFLLSRAFLLPIRNLRYLGASTASSDGAALETLRKKKLALLEAVIRIVLEPKALPEIRCMALASLPGLALPQEQERVEGLLLELSSEDSLRWGFFDLAASWSHELAKGEHQRWHLGTLLWLLTDCPSIQPIWDHVNHVAKSVARSAQFTIFKDRSQNSKDSIREDDGTRRNPGIVFYPEFVEHTTQGHFECRERVQFIYDWLTYLDQDTFYWIRKPRKVDDADLVKVHHAGTDIWPDDEEGAEKDRLQKLEPETWEFYVVDVQDAWQKRRDGGQPREIPVRFDMYEPALASAGAVLDCVDHVKFGGRCAWAVNRPPGHLANNAICLFNNAAVGAAYARDTRGYRRIVIFDFDAHCGVHTSRFCSQAKDIMYVSFHEGTEYGDRFYQAVEPGSSPTLHVPYDKERMGDDGYAWLVEKALLPVLEAYSPDLIFLSAGFDGHEEDPLNSGYLTDEAYRHLAQQLTDYAGGQVVPVPIVGTLEGGYGLRAMARCFSRFVWITGRCSEILEQKIPEQKIRTGPPHLQKPGESEDPGTDESDSASQSLNESDREKRRIEIEHAQEVIESLDLQRFLDVLAQGREP